MDLYHGKTEKRTIKYRILQKTDLLYVQFDVILLLLKMIIFFSGHYMTVYMVLLFIPHYAIIRVTSK